MTVDELIHALKKYPGHFDVRIASAGYRTKLQYEVDDTKSSVEIGIEEFEEGETELAADEENPEKLVEVEVQKNENANAVWIIEGNQIGYCPGAVFEY